MQERHLHPVWESDSDQRGTSLLFPPAGEELPPAGEELPPAAEELPPAAEELPPAGGDFEYREFFVETV